MGMMVWDNRLADAAGGSQESDSIRTTSIQTTCPRRVGKEVDDTLPRVVMLAAQGVGRSQDHWDVVGGAFNQSSRGNTRRLQCDP